MAYRKRTDSVRSTDLGDFFSCVGSCGDYKSNFMFRREREEGKAETEDAQKEAWRQCSRRLSTRLSVRSFFIYVFYMRDGVGLLSMVSDREISWWRVCWCRKQFFAASLSFSSNLLCNLQDAQLKPVYGLSQERRAKRSCYSQCSESIFRIIYDRQLTICLIFVFKRFLQFIFSITLQ